MDELEAELEFLANPSGRVPKSPEKPGTPFVDDELAELIRHPHTYVRRNIRSKVDDGLWLANLQSFYSYLDERVDHRSDTMNRCVKCTLPMGTCSHTEEWAVDPITLMEDIPLKTALVEEDTRDATTKELEDVLGLVGDGVQVETVQQMDDVDIRSLRWTFMQPRLSDKIGDSYVALSLPPPRGWHAVVTVGRFVVIHGGLRYRETETPQPFSGAAKYEDVEYLSDMYVYDILNQSWHSPEPEHRPAGRYGHVMAALDDKRILMYGGRGVRGRFLNDTWTFDIFSREWTPVSVDQSCPPPAPRVFSRCVSIPGAPTVYVNLEDNIYMDVLLFGGTDGKENFGDLWVFRSHPEDMRWERSVGVGPPPSPRYGHEFIKVSNRSVAVLGGCAVAPESELGAVMSVAHTDAKVLNDLCTDLQRAYQAEGASLGLAGRSIQLELEAASVRGQIGPGVAGEEIKAVLRQAAGLAGTMQRLEQTTRDAETALVQAFFDMRAAKVMRTNRAKHPHKTLDVTFLDFNDMTWKEQIYPPITGNIPPPRMHFGATAIGPYLLVVGGTAPSSLGHIPLDHPACRVYSLDLRSMKWAQSPPLDSTEYLEGPLRAADGDIKRAQLRASEAKNRGMSLGAKRGVTVDYLEAEKVLEVCRWRKRMLIRERDEFRAPPSSRWGMTLTPIDQRAIFLGGWGSKQVIPRGDIYTLDLEQDLERRRRMEAEFRSKLENERSVQEKHALQLEIQSAYELRAIIAAEKAQEANEREQMAIEEVRSAMPPLSIPKQVELVKANDRTMWLTWERILKDADNYPLKDPDNVTYFLYGRGGFQQLYDGDRVIVKCFLELPKPEDEEEANKKKKGNNSDSDSSSTDSSTDSDDETHASVHIPPPTSEPELDGTIPPDMIIPENTKVVDAWGEIIKGFPGGTFDVAFDDGSVAKRVDRSRIRLETALEPRPFEPLHAVIVKSGLRKKMREKGKFKRDPEELAAEEEKREEERKGKEEAEAIEEARKKAERQRLLGDMDSQMAKIKEASRRRAERKAKQQEEADAAIIKPTVVPGPEWRLLFVGKEQHYAVTSIMPDDVLYREPDRVCPMTFCVQSEGVDFPPGERSQLSKPITFWTTHNVENKKNCGVLHGKTISRAKKEVITAVLQDKTVEVEKISNYVYTHGAADHYV